MEFSSIAFCAENKRRINFQTIPHLSSGIHQPNMGMHQSEIPYVKLTGHKAEESLVHPTFEMTELNLARGFGFAEKIQNFTSNTKNFMRCGNFMQRKEMYGQQFPEIAFSSLVGGFVGSKSQLGSSSKESCQIWDVIIDKLAEFCGAPQSACHKMFAGKDSQSYYNLGKNLSQEILGSFYQTNITTLAEPGIVTETTGSVTLETVAEVPSCASNNSSCTSKLATAVESSGVHTSSDISKQSYAEVARTFAVTQQSKQQSTNMQQRRNVVQCRKMPRNNARQFNCSVDNWRYRHNPQVECRNRFKLPVSYKKPNHYQHYKPVANLVKEDKTERSSRHMPESNFQRVADKRSVNRHPVQRVPSNNSSEKVHVVDSSCADRISNQKKEIKDEVFTNSCIAAKCSSPPAEEGEKCVVFACEVGNVSIVQGNLQMSSVVPESSEDTSPRRRFSSECSTDSEDSFVIFESSVDCDSMTIVALMRPPSVTDSELSEDGNVYQFSDDEDDDEEEVEDDTEVRFAGDGVLKTVHPMVVWNYAYRAARSGPWEQMARDRERFKSRIRQMEPLLTPILSEKNRLHVWNERMAELRSEVT